MTNLRVLSEGKNRSLWFRIRRRKALQRGRFTSEDVGRIYRVPYWFIESGRSRPSWRQRPLWRFYAWWWGRDA